MCLVPTNIIYESSLGQCGEGGAARANGAGEEERVEKTKCAAFHLIYEDRIPHGVIREISRYGPVMHLTNFTEKINIFFLLLQGSHKLVPKFSGRAVVSKGRNRSFPEFNSFSDPHLLLDIYISVPNKS